MRRRRADPRSAPAADCPRRASPPSRSARRRRWTSRPAQLPCVCPGRGIEHGPHLLGRGHAPCQFRGLAHGFPAGRCACDDFLRLVPRHVRSGPGGDEPRPRPPCGRRLSGRPCRGGPCAGAFSGVVRTSGAGSAAAGGDGTGSVSAASSPSTGRSTGSSTSSESAGRSAGSLSQPLDQPTQLVVTRGEFVLGGHQPTGRRRLALLAQLLGLPHDAAQLPDPKAHGVHVPDARARMRQGCPATQYRSGPGTVCRRSAVAESRPAAAPSSCPSAAAVPASPVARP